MIVTYYLIRDTVVIANAKGCKDNHILGQSPGWKTILVRLGSLNWIR